MRMNIEHITPILNVSNMEQSFPFDAPWNVREFHLRHPDGHIFRVGASLEEE
jgi:hypothetical protein